MKELFIYNLEYVLFNVKQFAIFYFNGRLPRIVREKAIADNDKEPGNPAQM